MSADGACPQAVASSTVTPEPSCGDSRRSTSFSDRLLLPQLGDLLPVVADLEQDLLGVLPPLGSGFRCIQRRRLERDRVAGEAHLAELVVRDLRDVAVHARLLA